MSGHVLKMEMKHKTFINFHDAASSFLFLFGKLIQIQAD